MFRCRPILAGSCGWFHVARLGEPALPLRVEVWQGKRRLAENDYDLRFHDPRRGMRLDDWLRRRAADALLRFRLGLLRAI